MKHTALLLWVISIFLSCSTPPPKSVNTITGTIEGLKPDDKIWIVVNDTFYNGWVVADTITVTEKNKFTHSTHIKDKPIYLSYIPAEHVNDPEYLNIRGDGVEIFLEGYEDISLSGNVAEWNAVYPEGGLYLLPDIQLMNKRMKEISKLRSQFRTLLASIEEYTEDNLEIQRKLTLIAKECDEKERQLLFLKRNFYKNNPDKSYAAYLLFNDHALKERHFPTYEKTFQAFSPHVKVTESGAQIESELDLLRESGVGATLQEFDLLCLDGTRVKLSDYRGKYVLIDFWASWCAPCRMATPNLMQLYQQLEDRDDCEIIGIACNDKEENWRKAVEEDKLAWIQLLDDKGPGAGSVRNKYKIRVLPLALFVDPDGKILFRGFPGELAAIIPDLLSGKEDHASLIEKILTP